jgi:hypothetical protein
MTNSTEQSASWEVAIRLAGDEVAHLLWDQKVYKNPPLLPIQSHLNRPNVTEQFTINVN